MRDAFSIDVDRILHSQAYTSYIDKTQVFYLVGHQGISHRVIHVQLLSRIARTIGRRLGLNDDLIEAVSIGHDIGHPPFGHDGEQYLDELCMQAGIGPFRHNVQAIQALERIEKGGKGLQPHPPGLRRGSSATMARPPSRHCAPRPRSLSTTSTGRSSSSVRAGPRRP